jgi:dipeptidyl aminopeptidase/acylaminoacyl peptidase
LTVSDRVKVRLRDADTGKVISVLAGHVGIVVKATFSPDGRRVLTLSSDDTARLWDADTGRVMIVLSGHEDSAEGGAPNKGILPRGDDVMGATFSPDGRRVLTVSRDNTARLWHVFPTTQELVDDAKQIVPRGLSGIQREKAFLDPEPPAWCINMEKWPYHTQDWKDWLKYKRATANPPFPDAHEWQPWLAARKSGKGPPDESEK